MMLSMMQLPVGLHMEIERFPRPARIVMFGIVDDGRGIGQCRFAHPDPDQMVLFTTG
jgi:hypothetical protein